MPARLSLEKELRNQVVGQFEGYGLNRLRKNLVLTQGLKAL
jgi:hypothetical protein